LHPSLTSALVFGLAPLWLQAFGAQPASAAAEQVVIDRDVVEAVHRGGARVLVDVRLLQPMRPEGELTDADRLAQRHAIATAQDSVLAGLGGTHFVLLRRYDTIPLLLLDVQDDAVTALERMGNLVLRVRLDIPKAPSAAR
jgi:hypothetical protein